MTLTVTNEHLGTEPGGSIVSENKMSIQHYFIKNKISILIPTKL